MTTSKRLSIILTVVLVIGFGVGVFFMTSLGAGTLDKLGVGPAHREADQPAAAAPVSDLQVPQEGKQLLNRKRLPRSG